VTQHTVWNTIKFIILTMLGLFFNEHFNWTNHIQHIICKANSANALLWRNISSCPLKIKKICCPAKVHSILEYASTVWCLHTNCDIHKFSVELPDLRQIVIHLGSVYLNSCITLILPTLEERCKNLKLVKMYKMIHGQVQVKSGSCLIQATSHTQGHSQRFLEPYSRIDAHLHSYYLTTIRLWNGLSSSDVESPNIDLFKQHVNFR